MIQDVDETLRQFLFVELSAIPGCPVKKQDQITFEHPCVADSSQSSSPTLNLFLYDLRENLSLRQSAINRTGRAGDMERGVKSPAVHLDLSYLITVYSSGSVSQEHRLLTEALGVFLRNPIIPSNHFSGEYIGQQSGAIVNRIAQPESITKSDTILLWQALGCKFRASLPLVVTAQYDPFSSEFTPIVRELVLDFKQPAISGSVSDSLDTKRVGISIVGVATNQETGETIPDVYLSIEGRRDNVRTDANGFFSFTNLPMGVHTLQVKKAGFLLQEIKAEVKGASVEMPDPIIISLCPMPLQPAVLEPPKRIAGRSSQKKLPPSSE